MLVEEKPRIEAEKKALEAQSSLNNLTKLTTKEMILEKTNELTLIGYLVAGFDPLNLEGNYKSKFSSRISIYFGKVSKKWRFKCHQTDHEGDVFALWGYCYGLDYQTQLNDILEHINARLSLGL